MDSRSDNGLRIRVGEGQPGFSIFNRRMDEAALERFQIPAGVIALFRFEDGDLELISQSA